MLFNLYQVLSRFCLQGENYAIVVTEEILDT